MQGTNKTDKRKDRLSKRAKQITTIDNILAQENVKDTIERLTSEQAEITDMICIFRDREGALNWRVTKDTACERIISMLEQAKICLLVGDEE